MISRLRSAAGKLLRLLAKPVRRTDSQGPIVIDTFRGYASKDALFMMGRVMHQPEGDGPGDFSDSASLWNVIRRMRRRGVSGARLIATVDSQRQGLITDRDGYFSLRMRFRQPLLPHRATARVHLQLIKPAIAEAVGEVLVAPPSARFMVISDFDDTVVATGVANKIRMISRMLMRRTINSGIKAGINAMAKTGRESSRTADAGNAPPEAAAAPQPSRQERRQKRQLTRAARQSRQAARMARRAGRLS